LEETEEAESVDGLRAVEVVVAVYHWSRGVRRIG
jgi:hypothetical protein